MIEFGPDGFLYFGVGDGGSGNDPGNNAQNPGVLLSKISRIDVNTTSLGLPYGIPADNPFAGVSGARAEIFALGLRNPFRFSFDRGTGQLVAGDVGQGAWEEIDVIARGGNYGWRVFEGNHCTNIDPGRCVAGNFVPPIAEYFHDAGRCSVTGGYVYRGTRGTLPLGTYLFADFCTGEIFTLNGGAPSVLLDTGLSISSFGEDAAGELYVVDLGGSVQRLVSASGVATLVGAVLPSSRSVTIGTPATAFAMIINTSDVTAIECSLSVSVALPAAFANQTTDPTTNAVTGTPNTPVDIAPQSSQSFVFALTPTAAVASTAFPISYQCQNSAVGPFFAGVNEFRLSANATPTPDVVALPATLTNDGIVNVSDVGGTGVFAVATSNVGSGGMITASPDTGSLNLPLTLLICQTNPVSGVCLSPPSSNVSTQIDAGATPTFAILVTANGAVAFDPTISRVFVRFKDAGNIVRGATSVAVRTQ